jgi:23S rRNA pseudouridine1911/1915/1917 synthase
MNLPDILFEDESLVAFDKPDGLPVAQDRGAKAGVTLMDLVRARYGSQVANVHRLDADASGVVLCAKTKAALDILSGQFQSKTVRRVYRALVAILPPERLMGAAAPTRDAAGSLPGEFSVDLAIGDDEKVRGRMRVFRKRGGKPSFTQFRVTEAFGRFAFVECVPQTGRTHQVRVHLAAAGAPVLNDSLYGDAGSLLLLSGLKRHYKGREEEKPLISRLALHACALGFTHPVLREPVEVASPLPREFEVPLKYLRKFPGPAAARPAYGIG